MKTVWYLFVGLMLMGLYVYLDPPFGVFTVITVIAAGISMGLSWNSFFNVKGAQLHQINIEEAEEENFIREDRDAKLMREQ